MWHLLVVATRSQYPYSMKTMKIEGDVVELSESFPIHPYFASQAWSRKRSRDIYSMYVAEEGITLKQVGQRFGISPERARQIICKVARIIRNLEAGNRYYGKTAENCET